MILAYQTSLRGESRSAYGICGREGPQRAPMDGSRAPMDRAGLTPDRNTLGLKPTP